MRKNFEISSLGDIQWYLGIEVERDEAGDFYLCQRKCISEVVKSTGLDDAKSSNIPLDPGYGKNDDKQIPLPDNKQYQKLFSRTTFVHRSKYST